MRTPPDSWIERQEPEPPADAEPCDICGRRQGYRREGLLHITYICDECHRDEP